MMTLYHKIQWEACVLNDRVNNPVRPDTDEKLKQDIAARRVMQQLIGTDLHSSYERVRLRLFGRLIYHTHENNPSLF